MINKRTSIAIFLVVSLAFIVVLVLSIVLSRSTPDDECRPDLPGIMVLDVATRKVGKSGKVELRFYCKPDISGFLTRFSSAANNSYSRSYPPNYTDKDGISGYFDRKGKLCSIGVKIPSIKSDEFLESMRYAAVVRKKSCRGLHILYISWGGLDAGTYAVNAPTLTSHIPMDISGRPTFDIKAEMKFKSEPTLHTGSAETSVSSFDPRAGVTHMITEYMFGKEASVACNLFEWFTRKGKSCFKNVKLTTGRKKGNVVKMNLRINNNDFKGEHPWLVCVQLSHTQKYTKKHSSLITQRDLCTETNYDKTKSLEAKPSVISWTNIHKMNDNKTYYIKFNPGELVNIGCVYTGNVVHPPKVRIQYKNGAEKELPQYFVYDGLTVQYGAGLWEAKSFSIGDRIVCSSPKIKSKDWVEVALSPTKEHILIFRNYTQFSYR
ncbi:uncharacterized protein LOC141899720 [Tubulanus polymorphus]|uniref:uncharacterized protein LOC141899720 n=1 Tax=Tubulanus polymorphus TaxID=672921 RepID=UPI003DA2EA0C